MSAQHNGPDSSPTPPRLDEALLTYLEAVEAGRAPDRHAWLARYPDLAAELTEFFDNRDRLERLAEPLRSVTRAARQEEATSDPAATLDVASPAGPSLQGTRARQVGDYELLEELGRGGMGVVYKARHCKLKRLAALKMILTGEHAGDQELARFRAEAEAVARLQHPNIVQIYEVGEHGGHAYLALELCPGGSLDRKLAGGPLPPPEAARLLEAVARAMHAAHQAGVVHRDLKPSNVLLGADGTPKVTDFGLAKRLGEAGQTQSGAILGTPSYMAPEQAEGKKDVGPAADVYALGAVLYECLTGRPPFKASTPLDTILQVISDDPVPLRRLNPQVPRDLETVCLKCLHKEPGRRYPGARELADDLARFLAGEPIRARPVGLAERAVKWVKRRPAVAALLAALVLVTAAGFAGISWKYVEAQQETRQKELEQRKTQTYADKLKEEGEKTRRELHRADFALYLNQVQLAQREADGRNLARALEVLDDCRWDLRGWEWYHLYGNCRAELYRFRLWPASVARLRLSPDGRQIAGVVYDPDLKLWDAQTGREVHTLKGHTGVVHDLAFSPDGRRLASAGSDRTVRLWDVRSGRPVRALGRHDRPVLSVCFHPGGQQLASSGSAWDARKQREVGEVKVWDGRTGRELFALRGGPGPVNRLCFSPDGGLLAASAGNPWQSGGSAQVTLWDLKSRQVLFSHGGLTDAIRAGNFSPDGQRLASGTTDREVKVWDAHTGQELRTLAVRPGTRPGSDGVYRSCFSPDGRRLAAAVGGAVRVWDARTGRETWSGKSEGGEVLDLSFSPDGRRLAYARGSRFAAGGGGEVRMVDLGTGQEVFPLNNQVNGTRAVSFSPDGQRLTSINRDATVVGWDARGHPVTRTLNWDIGFASAVCFSPDGDRLALGTGPLVPWAGGLQLMGAHTGRPLLSLTGRTGLVRGVAFDPAGKRLASASDDGTVRVWDPATGRELLRLTGRPGGPRTGVCFSPDGKLLASSGWYGKVRVWDAETGRDLLTLEGPGGSAWGVCFSPDGRRLACGAGTSRDFRAPGAVRVWDAHTGAELSTLRGHRYDVLGVCFSPDGKLLASASSDRTVRLWDANTGMVLHTLKGHTDTVTAVCFSPDGRRLASAGSDRTVRLWDPDTGQETFTLRGHTSEVRGVCFSPDGRRLASAGAEVKLWETRPEPFRLRKDRDGRPFARAGFSRDGTHIVAQAAPARPGEPGEVRSWDAVTGIEIFPGPEVPPAGDGPAHSPDGHLVVAVTGEDLEVRRTRDTTPPARARRRREEGWAALAWQREQAILAEAAQDWFASATHLNQLLAAEPDEVSLYRHRMLDRARLGHRSEAIADLERSLEKWPEGRWAAQDWWWPNFLWQIDTASLLAEADRRVARAPAAWAPRAGRGWLLGIDRRWGPAAADLDEAARQQPRRPSLWAALARAELEQGHTDRAESARRKLAALSPEGLPAWHDREAGRHEARWQWPAAYWHLGHLVASRPLDISLRRRRARAALETGRWREAAADLARVVTDDPHDDLSRIWLARARLAAGDLPGYRKACAALLAEVSRTKDSPWEDQVARVCVLADGTADPRQVVRLADRKAASVKVPDWVATAGAARLRAGQPEQAVRRLQEAVALRRGQTNPADELFLALAYQRLGKTAEARRWLSRGTAPPEPPPSITQTLRVWGSAASGPLGVLLTERAGPITFRPPLQYWAERLDVELLRREAERLIRGSRAPGP